MQEVCQPYFGGRIKKNRLAGETSARYAGSMAAKRWCDCYSVTGFRVHKERIPFSRHFQFRLLHETTPHLSLP